MPNLKPPLAAVAQAEDYRRRILASLPAGMRFQLPMTLYLIEGAPADEIARATNRDSVFAVKCCPAGATTHSQSGVRNERIALERASWLVPDEYQLAGSSRKPMRAGESAAWSLVEAASP